MTLRKWYISFKYSRKRLFVFKSVKTKGLHRQGKSNKIVKFTFRGDENAWY